MHTQTLRKIEIRKDLDCPVVASSKPRFEWLPIEALRIDDRYQRPLNAGSWKAIRKIAKNFDWKFFSIVDVSKREGGVYAIIDSQHRVHGAAMAGMTHVPCLVHTMTLEEEAEAFAAINGNVVAMTYWSMYRASLFAGEAWALASSKCVSDAGCTLMTNNKASASKKGGEIFTIQDVRKKVEAGKAKEVTFALKVLRDSVHGDEPQYYTSVWLKAIMAALMERYTRLHDKNDQVVKAFSEMDLDTIEDKAFDEVKRRRRAGLDAFSKWELMRIYLGTAIDKKLPAKMNATPP